MRRTTILIAIPLSVMWLSAGPAAARQPIREVARFVVLESLPSEMCGFPLTFEVRGRTTMKLYLRADSEPMRATSTGPIIITFSREDTGEIRRFSIPGPSFYSADGRLVRGVGPWFAFSAQGEPVIAAGNWTFDAGYPDGVGKIVEVCDLLA